MTKGLEKGLKQTERLPKPEKNPVPYPEFNFSILTSISNQTVQTQWISQSQATSHLWCRNRRKEGTS